MLSSSPPPSSRPHSGTHRHEIHRAKLQSLKREAEMLAGTASQIAQAIDELLNQSGGKIDLSSKIQFITGCYARMMKDVGVVENLQVQGVFQKRPPARA